MRNYDVYSKKFSSTKKFKAFVAELLSEGLLSAVKKELPVKHWNKGYNIIIPDSPIIPDVINIYVDTSYERFPPLTKFLKKLKVIDNITTRPLLSDPIFLGTLFPEFNIHCSYGIPPWLTEEEGDEWQRFGRRCSAPDLIIFKDSPDAYPTGCVNTSYYNIPELVYARKWYENVCKIRESKGTLFLIQKFQISFPNFEESPMKEFYDKL